MILTKSFTYNKNKYKYIFGDIHGLIEFFKLDLKIIPNFENLINEINFAKYNSIVDIHGLSGCLAMKIKNKIIFIFIF